MGKVPILVRIDKEVAEELKILVLAKYKKLKGGLSLEVEEAIKYWLELHKKDKELKNIFDTHTHMHKLYWKQGISSENKVKEKIMVIIKNLKEMGIENEFTVAHWNAACLKVGYTDYRTINKYLNLAEQLDMIVIVRPGIFKLVSEKHE
jgi:hypothetical protein